MKNLDFAEKHGKVYSPYNKNGIDKIKLFPYQIDVLNEFETHRFIAIQHSRQMGLTTMLSFHIANFLLHNKTNKKLLCFKSQNSNNGKDIINKVRNLLSQYEHDTNKILIRCKNNQLSIKLSNNNEIRIISDINSLQLPDKMKDNESQKDKDYVYGLIIDNAAYAKDLDRLLKDFITIDLEQIILISNKRLEANIFNDDIFKNPNNSFYKKTINWRLNPNFTDEWYENIKKGFGHDLDKFSCEIDLIDIPLKQTNKENIINVRLDNESMNKISSKLIERDITLSEYIRTLIKNDI